MNASDKTVVRPLLFVCSSEERVDIADDIKNGLVDVADVVLWKDDGVFPPSDTFLESLLSQAAQADFAVVVLSPDDTVTSRNQNLTIPRDNLVFEAGLFMGELGRHRTFLVASNSLDFKLPSDIQGINIAKYNRSTANPYSLVFPVLRRAILKLGKLDRSQPADQAPLINVSSARDAFLSAVKEAPPQMQVETDLLGLDFSIACDYACDLLAEDESHHLFMRILIMDESCQATDPTEVADWRTYVNASISRLRRKAPPSIASRAKKGLNTTVDLRTYCDLPTVHGVFIRSPDREQAFLSMCCFQAKPPHNFTWGESNYYAFHLPAPKSSSASLLANAFMGFFGQRWPNAKPVWRIDQ